MQRSALIANRNSMAKNIQFGLPLGRPLNTLAQVGTKAKLRSTERPMITVNGHGAEVKNVESLRNRAKRKMITQKLMLFLIDVAIGKGERERTQPYWNTYYCQNEIIRSGDRIYGKYCKNRFCTVCSAIRKAEIINKYLPKIQRWDDPHFVTLTAKAVPANKLRSRIDRMIMSLRKILDRNKKRAQRGKEIRLVGVRSLESNFNPVLRTYNPHFHFIVANREMGEILIREWLKQCTYDYAREYAQKSKRVWDNETALIEIVKYSMKVFTDPTMIKKQKGKSTAPKATPYVYISAIDNIIMALQGHRIFEHFGFTLSQRKVSSKIRQKQVTDYTELKYDSHLYDWIDSDTENLLTGYVPSRIFLSILESNIDTTLQ